MTTEQTENGVSGMRRPDEMTPDDLLGMLDTMESGVIRSGKLLCNKPYALHFIRLARVGLAAEGLREALESIAAEKCKPSFDEQLHRLERGTLVSIIDTDTSLARDALSAYDRATKDPKP